MTKGNLFKLTLYKSYCEGSFMCEPNILIGPQKNRVPTIGAVCGKSLHVGAGGDKVNSLALHLRRPAAVAPT